MILTQLHLTLKLMFSTVKSSDDHICISVEVSMKQPYGIIQSILSMHN